MHLYNFRSSVNCLTLQCFSFSQRSLITSLNNKGIPKLTNSLERKLLVFILWVWLLRKLPNCIIKWGENPIGQVKGFREFGIDWIYLSSTFQNLQKINFILDEIDWGSLLFTEITFFSFYHSLARPGKLIINHTFKKFKHR